MDSNDLNLCRQRCADPLGKANLDIGGNEILALGLGLHVVTTRMNLVG